MKGSCEELKDEIEFFEENLEEFLKDHEGKWALVKNCKLVGAYDTFKEADQDGIDRFGSDPFLIREVRENRKVYTSGYLRSVGDH